MNSNRPTKLSDRLQLAVSCLKNLAGRSDFYRNWRGIGDGSDPDQPCVALVQYARKHSCVLDDVLQEQLEEINGVLESDKPVRSRKKLTDVIGILTGMDDRAQVNQVALGLRGLIDTVRSAISWTQRQRLDSDPIADAQSEKDSVEALARAAAAYQVAWRFSRKPYWPPPEGPFNAAGDIGSIFSLLAFRARFQQEVSDWKAELGLPKDSTAMDDNGQPALDPTTCLILRHLLGVLLNEQVDKRTADAGGPFINDAKLLLYDGRVGQVRRMPVTRSESSVKGFFPDPLAFNAAMMDGTFCDSLRAAWRTCLDQYSKDSAYRPQSPVFSLRLAPEFDDWDLGLEESSAGALAACAMYATATGQPLDHNRSATCELQLKGVDLDSEEDLPVGRVELKQIDELGAKIEEARRQGLKAIVVEEKQAKKWLKKHPEDEHFVLAASDLGEMLEKLIGDARYEDWLEAICQLQSEEVRALHGRDAIDRKQERPEEGLWDEHRLECYVWPNYSVEPQRPQQSWRVQNAPPVERTPVEGIGQERLIYLLREMTEKGRRQAVYDNAGSGKTVFSYKCVETLCDPVHGFRLFERQRPPLVLRWHGSLPKGIKSKTLKKVLLEALRRRLQDAEDRVFLRQSVVKMTGEQLQECLDYLVRDRRLVLILDGFDQFPREQRDIVANWMGDDNSDPNVKLANRCHWIFTGREFVIRQNQSRIFGDLGWTYVRIEPFTPEQQDEYFHDLPRWLETVPSRETVAELLGLPLILRQIRYIVENAPSDQPLTQFQTEGELNLLAAETLLQRALIQHGEESEPGQIRKLMEVVSLLAFQMMLEENYNGYIEPDGKPSTSVDYFLGSAEERYLKNSQTESQRKRREKEWQRSLEILRKIEFSYRSMVEAMNDVCVSFRSRKAMEWYAAWYLTNHATQWDLTGDNNQYDLEEQCAWTFMTDPQWKDCWSRTIEMPIDSCHPRNVEASFSLLFSPPKRPKQPVESFLRQIGDSVTGNSTGHEIERLGLIDRWTAKLVRPTAIMFHAWQVMQRGCDAKIEKWITIRREVLGRYRQQFPAILSASEQLSPDIEPDEESEPAFRVNRAQRAAELIHETDLWTLVQNGMTGTYSFHDLRPEYCRDLERLSGNAQRSASAPDLFITDDFLQNWFTSGLHEHIKTQPEHAAFSLCSNSNSERSNCRETLTFLMGLPEGSPYADAGVGRWQWVEIQSFYMGTCCVTRAQYSLFDSQHISSRASGEEGFDAVAPDPDCPVVHTSWYDAFCFALWLPEFTDGKGGIAIYQLPSEHQHEGASWGGIDREGRPDIVIGVEPYNASFTVSHVNYDPIGYYSVGKEFSVQRLEKAGCTLPVRWDSKRVEQGVKREADVTWPPAAYSPNGFKLWHINGNVDEWCRSRWIYELSEAIERSEEEVASTSSVERRCIRGGSWLHVPERSFSSYRVSFPPEFGMTSFGFRLSRNRTR